jgi:hypothetical protein
LIFIEHRDDLHDCGVIASAAAGNYVMYKHSAVLLHISPHELAGRPEPGIMALHLISCTGQRGPLARARRASEVRSAQPSSSATAR